MLCPSVMSGASFGYWGNEMDIQGQARKAEVLRKLHTSGRILILANAWDVASARIFEEMGFPAIATTSAMVLGEVQYPGRVELLAPHSLLDVIGLTGGETPLAGNEVEVKPEDASGKAIRVYHYSRGSNGDAIRNVMVKPGDTVIVKRAGIVYVLGAVNRPGGYPMQEDGELNVAQAISLAQGMAMQARTGGLRVVKHSVDGQPINVPVSYNRMMNGKEIPMNLAAGDIVYVPVSKIKTVFTTSSSLIGETAAATIYK